MNILLYTKIVIVPAPEAKIAIFGIVGGHLGKYNIFYMRPDLNYVFEWICLYDPKVNPCQRNHLHYGLVCIQYSFSMYIQTLSSTSEPSYIDPWWINGKYSGHDNKIKTDCLPSMISESKQIIYVIFIVPVFPSITWAKDLLQRYRPLIYRHHGKTRLRVFLF